MDSDLNSIVPVPSIDCRGSGGGDDGLALEQHELSLPSTATENCEASSIPIVKRDELAFSQGDDDGVVTENMSMSSQTGVAIPHFTSNEKGNNMRYQQNDGTAVSTTNSPSPLHSSRHAVSATTNVSSAKEAIERNDKGGKSTANDSFHRENSLASPPWPLSADSNTCNDLSLQHDGSLFDDLAAMSPSCQEESFMTARTSESTSPVSSRFGFGSVCRATSSGTNVVARDEIQSPISLPTTESVRSDTAPPLPQGSIRRRHRTLSTHANGGLASLSFFSAVSDDMDADVSGDRSHPTTASASPSVVSHAIASTAIGAESSSCIHSLIAPSGPPETNHQGPTPLSSPTISDAEPQARQQQQVQQPRAIDLEFLDPDDDALQREYNDCCCTVTLCVATFILCLLYVGIAICWVVMASFYFSSMNQQQRCNVPLRFHFWMATGLVFWTVLRRFLFQLTQRLVLDPLRQSSLCIMLRHFINWLFHRADHYNPNGRSRINVIAYNLVYMAYAGFVLQLGIQCVYIQHGGTCRFTLPGLFHSTKAFVNLSMATWFTDVFGIIGPLFIWEMLHRCYGYTPPSPSTDTHSETVFVVFGLGGIGSLGFGESPRTGAPPGCIERMQVVAWEDFPDSYARDCCICMGEFVSGDVIVATPCHHVFHKRCCQFWLRRSRSCPMCREDIPSSLNPPLDEEPTAAPPLPTSLLNHQPPSPMNRPMSIPELERMVEALHQQQEAHRQRRGSANGLPPATHIEFVVGNENVNARFGFRLTLAQTNASPRQDDGRSLANAIPSVSDSEQGIVGTVTLRALPSASNGPIPDASIADDLVSMEEARVEVVNRRNA